MPSIAHANAGMTWLLEPAILGTPTLHRVGRGGGAAVWGSARKGWLNAWLSQSGACRLPSEKALRDLKVRRLDSRGEVRWRRP